MVKIRSGDIVYINFDPAAGSEIQKRRPAIVVSNDILMQTSPFVWVVPISHGSFDGEDYPLHVQLDSRTKTDGTVYIEQLKSFDYRTRKIEFIERIPSDLLDEISKKISLVVSK